jgi:hypothetical protein
MFDAYEKNKINIYLKQLNKKEFYEAHETIEEVWFPIRFNKNNLKVKIFKGLINAAVSFRLIQLDKVKQSKRPFNTFLKYSKYINKKDKYMKFINKLIVKKYMKEIKAQRNRNVK